MKILYVVMKYNMGRKQWGLSYEHYNFYDTLVKMDNSKHEVIYFPFDEIMLQVGKDRMNEMLLEKVNSEKPDLCFFVLVTNQIKLDTIRKITESGKTMTYNWFGDDEWRFDIFSKYMAPLFDFVSTTDPEAVEKYEKIGYKNAIRAQLACNHFLYKPDYPEGKRFEHDVSFIGKSYGDRPMLVDAVKARGFNVECWGRGWNNGIISQEDLVRVFSRSKVNLSFSKAQRNFNARDLLGIFLNQEITGEIRINPLKEWAPRIRNFVTVRPNQSKGRVFEIPGCGGFLLTETTNKLEDYYIDGKEIVIFKDKKDLVEKVEYYLKGEKERDAIANAGFKRTVSEHTYEKRFNEIFKRIGF